MKRVVYFAFNLVLAFLASTPVSAHQQKEAYITLLVNQRTGNVEIAHRFSLHDAEHAVKTLFMQKDDIQLSAKARHQFALYVEFKFKLKEGTGEQLDLQLVGHEIEGQYVWIYQESSIPSHLEKVSVKMDALQEVWPDQVNHINVEKQGQTFSARLHAGDGWQTINLYKTEDN